MTREEIESRGDETMMDAAQIKNQKPEEFFNVNYLRIYYGKSPFSFFLIIATFLIVFLVLDLSLKLL